MSHKSAEFVALLILKALQEHVWDGQNLISEVPVCMTLHRLLLAPSCCEIILTMHLLKNIDILNLLQLKVESLDCVSTATT